MKLHLMLYLITLQLVTGVFGVIEIVSGIFGESIIQLVPGDVFGGLVLLIIFAIFIRGLLLENEAYFCFGSLMLAVFSVLYFLVLVANWIDSVILGESWEVLNDVRIEILLFPLAIPGLMSFLKMKKELPP